MSDWSESEAKAELEKFKGISSAYHIASCPPLSGTYLTDSLLGEPDFAPELLALGAALLQLGTRISDRRVKAILDKLFERLPPQKAVKSWDQALSEIFAFAHFESLGILHSIGWPSDFPGDAPFDFAIQIQGNIVAGDVKPANGSGFRLLEESIRGCVSERAVESGTETPRVTVRYKGPLTQEIAGPNLRKVVSDFKSKIADADLSESQIVDLTIDLGSVLGSTMEGLSTRIAVYLGDAAPLGGGITGTSILSDALALTIKRHIEGKGNHGSTYDVCFFVVYVRLPGRGSADIKTHVSFSDAVAKAVRALGIPTSYWLGSLLLQPGTQVAVIAFLCKLERHFSASSGQELF